MSRWLCWLSPWLLLAGVFALTVWRYAPPEPVPATAPADVFSAERARASLVAVFDGVGAHPTGTDDHRLVVERLRTALVELGLEVDTASAPMACGDYRRCAPITNLVARIPGSRPDLGAVLVAGHHDSVAASQGAGDDGHALAVMLELARLSATRDWERDVVLLMTDAEEIGLIGASHFVAVHPLAERVDFVVNLEARGTTGPGVLFEIVGPDRQLVDLYGDHVPRPVTTSLARPLYEQLEHGTDLSIFGNAGLQGVNLAFLGGSIRYHTARDDLEHLDTGSLQHQGDQALGLVEALTRAEVSPSTTAEAGHGIYFDVLAATVVGWPAGATVWPAAIALVLVLLTVVLLLRRGALARRELALAMLCWPLGLAVSAALPVGAAFGLRALDVIPGFVPWFANSEAVAACYLALAATGVTGLAWLTRGRTGGAAWWGATWLWWSLCGLALAVWLEPASYVFVLPALAAGGVGLVVALGRRVEGAGWRLGAALLPLAVAAVLTIPLAWLVTSAVGLGPIQPGITLAALLMLAGLPVAVEAAPPRQGGRVVASVFGVALASAGVAAALPTWTPDEPMALNLLHRQHVGVDGATVERAHWLAMTVGEEVPGALASVVAFSEETEPMLPWEHELRAVYTAPAEAVVVEPPRLEVLSVSAFGALWRYDVWLSSPRGASVASLRWQEPRVFESLFAGQPIWLGEQQGWHGVELHGLPREGIEVSLWVEGEAPLELTLVDKVYALPASSAPLLEALPDWSAPVQDGHASLVSRTIVLQP